MGAARLGPPSESCAHQRCRSTRNEWRAPQRKNSVTLRASGPDVSSCVRSCGAPPSLTIYCPPPAPPTTSKLRALSGSTSGGRCTRGSHLPVQACLRVVVARVLPPVVPVRGGLPRYAMIVVCPGYRYLLVVAKFRSVGRKKHMFPCVKDHIHICCNQTENKHNKNIWIHKQRVNHDMANTPIKQPGAR